MNRQLRAIVAAVLALVVIVSLLGCETQQAAPATQAPAAATKAPAAPATQAPAAPATQAPATAPETVKIGFSVGLSGPSARSGITQQRVVQMALDDVNAKGGVKVGGKTYRLEGVFVDDKFSAEGGREAANRLVLADKVRFMTMGGQAAGGAQPLTEANKVLLLMMGAPDQYLGLKFPYTLGVGYPHTRMRLPALYAQLAKTHPNAKRVALMYDDTIMKPNLPIAQEAAQSNGQTIVATELFPMATKDFGPLVTRVLTQNPDAIDIGPMGSSAPVFLPLVRAFNEAGYRKPFFGVSGSPTALLQAGAAAEGYYFIGIADYNASVLAAGEKDIIQRYIKQYGESEFEPISMGSYVFAPLLAQAMEKANTIDDTEKIAKTLREGQWDTLWGKKGFSGAKTFGLPQYLDMNIYLSKFEGGKLITFDSFNGTVP